MLGSCSHKKQVDTIVYDALVYTVNDNFDTVSSFAVKDGKIVAAGDSETIMDNFRALHYLDAGRRPVYPGFNDGHSHFLSYGLTITTFADLVGTTSFDEVVARTVEHQKEFPSDWVQGRGWDQNDWQDQHFPTKEKLDQAFPETPVVLRRIDGHALIANSEAMKLAGINPTIKVAGGEILLANGEPTGIFIDNAMDLIDSVIPVASLQQKKLALQKAQQYCFAAGLTTVTDAGLDLDDIQLIDKLQKEDSLAMRVYAMMSPTQENFDYFFPKGPYHSGALTVSAVKLYIDGALGSRGALLLRPYSDDPGNYGLQLHPELYYEDICQKAFDAGFQVNTHAIGDSGNRIMLKTYAGFLDSINDKRWRVEHAQVVNRNDLHYFHDYSIIPSIQSTHCTSDMYWAEKRLGPARIKEAYAYKDLLDENGWLINGTDFPIEDISPIKTFYAAVARKDAKGWPEGGFQMENAISREEALKSITLWPAKGSFEESFKGSIEPGKAADFVILDQDIMKVPEDEILNTRVVSTYLGGQEVYKKK